MCEKGRSMVEMLGVLAIIGVLSVGAISGYSKAMMKYKLNRQTEQIGSILDYATIHYEALNGLRHEDISSTTQLFINLGLVPTEMIGADNRRLFDIFNNDIRLYHNKESSGAQYFGLEISIGSYSYNVCLNLFQMAKLRSAFLWQTLFSKTTIGSTSSQFANRVYGDDYCVNNCLKDLTLEKMRDLCNVCDETKTCYFYFLWNLKSGNS